VPSNWAIDSGSWSDESLGSSVLLGKAPCDAGVKRTASCLASSCRQTVKVVTRRVTCFRGARQDYFERGAETRFIT
jgi:hypothetical protein